MGKTRRDNNSNTSLGLNGIISTLNSKMVVARVTDIILDSSHDNFIDWSSIGTIFFEENNLVGSDTPTKAKPFFTNSPSYPLVNELVLLFSLPSKGMGSSTGKKTYYYINVIGIWNSPHHNAYPNPLKPKQSSNPSIKSYSEVEAGSTVKQTNYNSTTLNNNSTELNSPTNISQQTFIERSDIRPLLPFAGDIIHQGRWGNSIRFGSTVQNGAPNKINLNDWSDTGTNGDPITIIRNGQDPNLPDRGWEYTVENIEKDQSLIYLTSTQSIPLYKNLPLSSYGSKKTPDKPKSISTYTNPQVLINSDRLVFNAKTDHVLISGEKSVYLSSPNSLNFDSKNFIISVGENIKLGDNKANEPLIYGDSFLNDLNQVMESLSFLCKNLQSEQIWPAGAPAPAANIVGAAITCEGLINTFQQRMESYKSKTSFTI